MPMRYGVTTCGGWTLKASAVLLLLLVWDIAKRGWTLSWSRRAIKGTAAGGWSGPQL